MARLSLPRLSGPTGPPEVSILVLRMRAASPRRVVVDQIGVGMGSPLAYLPSMAPWWR